mmetsp:Transcript_56792/g.133084  ORF Transcript_56792/g.133084 Transcript_56792/m.133084 type:complete len:95 (+) Transcript_56792:1071-1355(+)
MALLHAKDCRALWLVTLREVPPLTRVARFKRQVAEGVATAKSIHFLALKKGVDMPICEMVYQVIYENKPVMEALAELQARPMTVDVEFMKTEDA